MKRLVVLLRTLLFVLIVAIGGMAIYVWRTWDRVYDVPLPDLHSSSDPGVIQRGEYLVLGPAHCVQCHSASFAEYQTVAGGNKPALTGGIKFAARGLGALYGKNLTPDPETGIGRYSDEQIARMMRWSVRPDGRASVRLLMPFHNMSNDDMIAIISFLRQQPPVRHEVPANEFTLLGKVVKSVAPTFKPRDEINPPAVAPPADPTRERGEYLARYVSDCVGCHTKRNPVTFAAVSPEFAGGEVQEPIELPGADKSTWFVTPNLTPADNSALMKFPDRATFIARFKNGGRFYPGSPMPWEAFTRMTESDIAALYEFLHSLAPQPGPTGEATFKKED